MKEIIDLFNSIHQKTNITAIVFTIVNIVCIIFAFPNKTDLLENDGALFLCNFLICSLCLFWGFKALRYDSFHTKADEIKRAIYLDHISTQKFTSYIGSAAASIIKITEYLRYILISWSILYFCMFLCWLYLNTNNDEITEIFKDHLRISRERLESIYIPSLLNGTNVITSYFLIKIFYILNSDEQTVKSTAALSLINVVSFLVLFFFIFNRSACPEEELADLMATNLVVSLVLGIFSCITFSLVLARLESKFTLTKSSFFVILFLYAALQMIYPLLLLGKPLFLNEISTLKKTVLIISNCFILFAFVAKTIFYSLFHQVITTHRIFIYFLKSYSDKNSPKQLDRLNKVFSQKIEE